MTRSPAQPDLFPAPPARDADRALRAPADFPGAVYALVDEHRRRRRAGLPSLTWTEARRFAGAVALAESEVAP